ncbi:MAG: hypothetical protein IJ984_07065, partial [Prevotella sp.]|nr:hypothetical protein [Prevotella sp.]
TSYIFKVNQLTRCALDAVYKKILPTFLGAFLMLLSYFKNYITQKQGEQYMSFVHQNWCSYDCPMAHLRVLNGPIRYRKPPFQSSKTAV